MSIIEPTDHTIGPDPVPSPLEPALQQVEDQTPAPAPQDVVVDHSTDPDYFPRAYVEELRDENARHRTRARDYEEVFGEMPDDIRSGWLELARLAQSEDPDARDYLAELLGFEPTVAETQQIVDANQPLSRDEMVQIARSEAQSLYEADRAERFEQEQARAQADSIMAIQSRARDEFNIDPASPDYVLLLKFANDVDPAALPAGQDVLAVAHQHLQDYQQAQWDAYEAKKRGEAGGAPVVPQPGVSPSIAVTPKTWDEARQSLHERLSAG